MHNKITYWMKSGMDSDVSDHLEPDEMYLMLQADMISIKRQKEALASEIEDIASDFQQMLQNAGLESDFPLHANPTTPSFVRTTASSLTRVSPLSTSSEDDLLQQMMAPPLCSLVDSTSSGSYYGDSVMTLIIDSNSNYVASPKAMPPQPDNTAVNVPNITELSTSSDMSNNSVTSSDGYPKSSDTSSDDNQCVPECLDLEQELVSRIQCYGDFTIDRQRKINDMSVRLTTGQLESVCDMTGTDTEELFTREVEGCEDQDLIPPPVRIGPVIGSSFPDDSCIVYSGTTSSGTDCSSSPTSSRRRHRRHSNRTSSSQGSRKSSSIPRASSTMIEDFSPSSVSSSGSSRHKTSSSLPRASSTMIEDTDLPPSKPGSAQCSSEEDLQSIYTWSIHDNSEDCSLEESYMKNFNRNHLVAKPPLPRKRVLSSTSSSSVSSRRSSNSNIHLTVGDSVLPMMESISVIEPSATLRDEYPVNESMYEEDLPLKTNSLPRTSTRINLFVNKSNGSSMEARRCSMPDIVSVCTEEFHSVPTSDDDSADDSSPLQERLELPGKSSSSSSHVSPPVLASTIDALCDSILTDSPPSVGSSGIYVPCNTPNPSDNSKASRSTNSDNRSEACAPPSSFVSTAAPEPKRSPSAVFKIPKNTTPLRKLFRFKRSKGKNNLISSNPGHVYPSSVRSDPVSKRNLFPFANKGSQESVQLMDKKAVIKKFKRFSASFNKRDRSGLTRIHTLANL